MSEQVEKIVMEHTAPVAETPLILHTEPKPDEPKPQPEPQQQPTEVTVTTTVPVQPKPAEKPDKE
jgi:hypothetical protein